LAEHFSYISGQLHCEQVSAEEIADTYGTPCYVYSASAFRDRFHTISEAFARWNPLVCFSVKSCGNLSVLRLLRECGSGFDVVSGGEIHRVLLAGVDPSKVVYAGVGKTEDEIDYALQVGIGMFNVESAGELSAVEQIASRRGCVARVAIRINPDVDPGTHEKTTTGKRENKFGVGWSEAAELFEEAKGRPAIGLLGLHVHLGSPIYSAEPYRRALARMVDFVCQARRKGHRIDTINIGGGYCVSYTGEEVIGPQEYAGALESFLEKLNCRLIIEPGRYIAGNSGVLLTRVLYRKESEHGKVFVVCDAAMNDLIRPTFYDAFHRIWPARSENGMPAMMCAQDSAYEGVATELVDVVGPVCESGDFLAKDRALPPVGPGDLLVVFGAGAYGFTMSSNYNARPRAPEILVERRQARLIRRRETYQDLVAAEADLL